MKKLLKIASISIASLIVILLMAMLLLSSSPGENFIRGWLEDRLSAEIGMPVSIANFETNIWSRIQIDTIAINTQADTADHPLLFIGRIRVGYSIPRLLGDEITVNELMIDSMAMALEIDSLGRFGIPLIDNPAPITEDSNEKTTTLSIDTVSLNGLALTYLDRQLPVSVELGDAVLSAQGSRDGSFSGTMAAGNILAIYDDLPLPIKDFEIAASLDGEVFHIKSAKADCEGLHLEANGNIALADSQTIDIKASISGSPDSIASAIAEAFDLPSIKAGQISVQCRVEGSMDSPGVNLVADVSDLEVQNIRVPSANIRAQYSNDLLQIDTFRVMAFGGAIHGNAAIVPDTIGISSLNLALDNIDIAAVWQAVYGEPSPYKGTISGPTAARGRGFDLSAWSVDAAVLGENLYYLGKSVPDLRCTAGAKTGHAVLSIIHGADRIQADIEFGQDSLSGTFEISIPNLTALSRFVDQPDLSGGVWARGTIGGAYLNPTLRSTLNGSKLVFRNFPADTIMAEISYQDSLLTIIDFNCEGRLDSVDAQRPPFGIDSVSGLFSYACRLQGAQDNLFGEFNARAEMLRYGSYDLDSLLVDAKLDGSNFSITELSAGRGDLKAGLKASYDTSTAGGSFEIMLQSLVAASEDDTTITGDTIKIKKNCGAINGDFTLGPESHLTANINGRALWLGLLPMLTEDTMVTGGELDFDLIVDGPYRTPDAIFDVMIRSLDIAGFGVDSISSHLRLMPKALILDSLISYALGHTLRAKGQLELGVSSDGMFEISDSASILAGLSTSDFDLSVLEGLAFPEGSMKGFVSTSLDIGGTLAAPRFDGWLKARDGMIMLGEGTSPIDNIGVSLEFADSVLTINSAEATVSDIGITASGSMSSSDLESVVMNLGVRIGKLGELAVDGTVSDTGVQIQIISDSLNLAVLQPFMTEIDSLTGRLNCLMEIYGAAAAPQIDGFLRIGNLSFSMPRQYVRLANGRASIRFDKSRIILDSASAALNGGTLALSGIITHDQGQLEDIGMKLHAHAIPLQKPGIYTLAIDSAAIEYGKHQENYIIGGDIVLGEARFTAGLRPTSILPWVKSMETVDLELPDLIARSRLDIRIRESSRLWVDNNLARIRIRAELGIIGTPLRPNFTGLIKIEEGYLLYLDRRFRVNEGTVYFIDPIRFNPDIKLDAATEITVYRRTTAEPYTVYIKAEGLLDQLQYGLYSEPQLDKPDIVSLLTLGATRAELSGGEGSGGVTGALKDRAANLTSKRISNYLSRKAGSLFGFEEFTIQGNLFDLNDSKGPQLTATKRLSQRIDLTYSTSVGHLNDQAMRLGYRLSSRFSLQGETDRQGRAGLDFKYGITFK